MNRVIITLLVAFVSTLPPGLTIAADPTTNSCVECHKEIHEQILSDFQSDVHKQAGLSCQDCHGGNPKIADESSMDKKYGFLGKPKREDTPQFCAKCHSDPAYMRPFNASLPTDQMEKYFTSRHGELLKKSKDAKVATCASCHKAHGILPANDVRSSVYPSNVPKTCASCHADAAYMAEYGIPTNQFAQYTDSLNVHGYALFVKGDMGAPTCNDCHSNHGAAPPGITHVAQVCTQCHALNGQLFRESPHKEAFDALSVPECAFCHQLQPNLSEPNARIHTIARPTNEMIGAGDKAVCTQCHSQGDEGFKMATEMRASMDSLDRRLDETREMIERAEAQGMEVSDARWKLKSEVLQTRMELKTSVHAFSPAVFRPAFEKTDTSIKGVHRLGEEAEAEIASRRIYFVVVTILIGLFVVALMLKIRAVKRDRE